MTSSTSSGAVARGSDPAESWQAADSITRQAQEVSKRKVLRELTVRGSQIAQQIEARLARSVSPSRVRTALTELERDGLARRTETRRRTASGRMARVWAATPQGVDEVQR